MPRGPKKEAEAGHVIQYTTIKVRLYPGAKQRELFEKTFGCCRYIWNRMLTDQQRFYYETDELFIPTPAKYKKDAPFLKEVDNQALIQEHNHLNKAFRAFFKNPKIFKHPKFKRKKDDRDSFTACNHDFESGPTIYTTRNGIRMTKAGVVKAKFSHRPQAWWKLKRITVEKTRTGKYYCYILYECQAREPKPVIPAAETTLGLKYSVRHFYVTNSGEEANQPHWLKLSQQKLTRIKQKLSRMQYGSKNYQETVQKYNLLREHITNQHHNFIHRESRRIANAWDAVCLRDDDMNIRSSLMGHGNTQLAGFGMFRECLRYKLERQGKQLLLVDHDFPSTKICFACGRGFQKGPTRYRTWICPNCSAAFNWEANAARNIKAKGLEQYFSMQEQRESA